MCAPPRSSRKRTAEAEDAEVDAGDADDATDEEAVADPLANSATKICRFFFFPAASSFSLDSARFRFSDSVAVRLVRV
jgi:hypothetical protein